MKILITGGRDFKDRVFLFGILDEVSKKHLASPDFRIIHGDARGADSLAEEWCKSRKVTSIRYPVTSEEWQRLGKKAGVLRNQEMLDKEKPHLLVAFSGKNGTADMIRRARKAGVTVIDTAYEGDVLF